MLFWDIHVLMNSEKGPADILLSNNKIVLDGVEIPCIKVGGFQKAITVTVADNIEIPGNSEVVIDVYVERQEDDDATTHTDYLVEPIENFKENYRLLMA